MTTRAGYDADLLGLLDPQWRSWLDLRYHVGSTNDAATELARAGSAHGAVVAAHRQSTGRGRRGAPWICPPGGGLAFSVVLRPCGPAHPWSRTAMVAGLAVACELEGLGLDARVKWPNDVLVGGRKICGILVEATPEFAIVGIGVNVNVSKFPPELRSIATSVQLELEPVRKGVDHGKSHGGSLKERRHPAGSAEILGRPEPAIRRETLLVGIRKGLLHWSEMATDQFPDVLDALENRCALRGKQITARTSGGTLTGIARGFGPAGELLLERNGKIESLTQADEIRVSRS